MKPKLSTDLPGFWLPATGLLLVTVLRFLFIETNDVAMDEPFTVFFAQADLHTLFGMLPHENNPPLYFLLMHYWVAWFSISPFPIRFLSCIFSILTAVMLYKTGKDFFSQHAGIFAAALFTLSDYHQLFAHEARVYALFALLTTVSMYLFLASTTKPARKQYFLLMALTNALLIYAHFFGFFIFLIQALSVLSIREYRRTILKPYLGSVIFSLLAYIPYFPIFFKRFFQSAAGGTWVEPPVISDLYTMLWRYMNAPVVTVAALVILAVALMNLISGAWKGGTVLNNRNIVLLIWFFVPYILMFLVSFIIPMFLDRYTVFISVGFYLLVAMAVNSLFKESKYSIILMTAFILMMAVTFHPGVDNKRRLKETIGFISGNKGPHTSVIICPQWLEYGFMYHYDQQKFKDYRHLRALLNQDGIYPANDLSALDTVKFRECDQVLYFEEWASVADPGKTISDYLERRFRFNETFTFYQNIKVHQYVK
ncbi:MAG: glycosyltransferase family 39 protein [Bacteroidales bacterium]|nr:glycosyltransferase family 39 protein [Bacteroidales bacterium]